MALPFFNRSSTKKRESIISVDLGGRTTKAVHILHKGESYSLNSYVVVDAPIYEKKLSVDMLAEHLKAVVQALDCRTRLVTLCVDTGDSLVRHTDLPQMPIDDMRQVLKMNSKKYLQQDLPDYVFDCSIISGAQGNANAGGAPDRGKSMSNSQLRVLVGGAKRQLVETMAAAAKSAGLTAVSIVPALIGSVNAFELAKPDIFAKEQVALIDMGFRNTSICILRAGELMLSRVVNLGGDRLTSGLVEALSTSYTEAEGIKVGMASEVQAHLEPLVSTLARELRASIDFFEHQQDKTVGQIFVSGGTARSEMIMQLLQAELMAECRTWDPTTFLQPALRPQQTAELEAVAGQLTVAIGAAVAAL